MVRSVLCNTTSNQHSGGTDSGTTHFNKQKLQKLQMKGEQRYSRCVHKSTLSLLPFLEENRTNTPFCLPMKQVDSRLERDRRKSSKAPKHLTIASSRTNLPN
uniref:Uncharacterized protein n=1 Tax=Arundo donax TaxID=35708 RepID=A0A0A8YFL3_ARUDO